MDYIIIKGQINYLLSSCPKNNEITQYSKLLKENNIEYLVNFCENEYSLVNFDNITYRNILIEDGKVPNEQQLYQWKKICNECITKNKNIALHCLSGLGRSPCMLCISLIEYERYSNFDSIKLLREKRKGCINSLQLKYISNYGNNKNNLYCIIM